jgi:hypothetical protein
MPCHLNLTTIHSCIGPIPTTQGRPRCSSDSIRTLPSKASNNKSIDLTIDPPTTTTTIGYAIIHIIVWS